jgi:hypothetical protein
VGKILGDRGNSTRARRFRNLGFGVVLAAWPAQAFSPDAEAVLDHLRRRISGGLAGQEAQTAFLAFLADADPAEEIGCGAWGQGTEAFEVRARHPDLDRAISEICPESGSPLSGVATASRAPGRRTLRVRTGITHAAKPRRALSPGPALDQEGSIAPVRWKASLRDLRPHARHVEVRVGEVSIHAGHLRSGFSRTRLGFVAGGGFYEGWSGTSGAGGALHSPYAALDGLGASIRDGAWTWDAAGTWNRLTPTGRPDRERRDALLYVAGLAREPSGGKVGKADGSGEGLGFRAQAAHQRFESASGRPFTVTVAGASLSGFRNRFRLGLAGSLLSQGVRPGGYAELSVAAPESAEGGFRLEVRQASPAWANPLQSPRGYLRDTVGEWPLSGRGEGAASLRSRFPVATVGGYRMSLHPGGLAAWALGSEELLAGEGRLALVQEWGPWTHESGMGLRYRGSALTSAESAPGWGQTLAWRRQGWKAEVSFLPRGKGYRGSRPAPLHVACGHRNEAGRKAGHSGAGFWDAEALSGDIRDPKRHLMLGLRQGWELSRGIRALHGLRLPWESGRLSAEMGYQLRLEALF